MAQAMATLSDPAADHFAVLGVPRRLDLDPADLERRYHEAARQVHPDRHQTASPREQERSLAASAALNQAYRTLRDPVTRGRYWLELHGDPLGAGNNRVPAELAALVFEVQEQLAEARDGYADRAAIDEARRTLSGRLAALGIALEAGYARDGGASDAAGLSALKRTLSEIAYLRTLLRDVDAVLAG
jgi:molecular chaperone HscB